MSARTDHTGAAAAAAPADAEEKDVKIPVEAADEATEAAATENVETAEAVGETADGTGSEQDAPAPAMTEEEMVEAEIPLLYYDTEASAPQGSYTIVISCSTSKYGDFMNGCTSNVLYVDDFQWVY